MQRDDPRFSGWFWAQVNVRSADECWMWVGQKGRPARRTHVVLHVYGGHYTQIGLGVHRVAYELSYGPIPQGKCVLHSCDNPPCCNPAHLFIGTKGDNIRDARDKGRALIGEKNPSVRLTEEQVLEIRRLYERGNGVELARRFGVDKSTIHLIVTRRKWKHI